MPSPNNIIFKFKSPVLIKLIEAYLERATLVAIFKEEATKNEVLIEVFSNGLLKA